jgi:hypothetical protein
MSDSGYIKLKLTELIKENQNIVIQLYGRWGTGKTYLWQEVVSNLDRDYKRKIVQVSLFDKNSVNELKEDILLKIYAYNNTLNRYGKHLDMLQNVLTKSLTGITIASVSSLLKAKDFKDVIISFDDIERRNKNFDFDTFLGFVSLLKDDKKCNIVLILNYDKLGKKDKKIFDKYKEKIIDYNLILRRSPSEALKIALEKQEINLEFTQELKMMTEDINIDNIRLLKHIIKMIKETEKIDFIKCNYNNDIKKLFMKAYISYAYIYYNHGIDNIQHLLKYQFTGALNRVNKKNSIPNEIIKINEKYEIILNLIDISTIFGSFDRKFLLTFDNIMKSHFISDNNVGNLKTYLQDLSTNKDLVNSSLQISGLRLKYLSDMKNHIGPYYEDIQKEIKNNEEKIIQYMRLSNFFYTTDLLNQENPKEIQKLEEVCIKHYIQWLSTCDNNQYDSQIDFNNRTPEYYLEERNPLYIKWLEEKKAKLRPIIDCKLIRNIAENYRKNNNNSEQDVSILNLLTEDEIYECFKKSPDFTHEIILFLKRNKRDKSYESFIKKIIFSFHKIYNEQDIEINKKIDIIFSHKDDMDILNQIKNEMKS